MSTMSIRLTCFLAMAILLWPFASVASSCDAKNDSGDTCSIDCAEGQQASCANGSGGARQPANAETQVGSDHGLKVVRPS